MAEDDNQKPLDLTYWMATENGPGVASLLVVGSRFGILPARVRVICALPWQGVTVAKISSGVFPENMNMVKPSHRAEFRDGQRVDDPDGPYDRNRVDRLDQFDLKANGTGGLLDATLEIRDCLFVRLLKQGARDIETFSGAPAPSPVPPARLAEIATVQVLESREESLSRCDLLPVYPSVLSGLSANYRIRMGAATRGTVGGQEHVVPSAAQSLFCEIDYSGAAPRMSEGAALNLHAFPGGFAGQDLSFWVFPHIKSDKMTVSLGLALGAWKKWVTLKPGQWQRVQLKILDLAACPDANLIFLGPDNYGKPGYDKAVTFEFNGMAQIHTTDSGARSISARPLEDGKQVIVLLGEPGKDACVRHYFSTAVEIAGVTAAGNTSGGKAFRWQYNKNTQILEITGLRFADAIEEPVLDHLNNTEKMNCQQKNLVPIVITADVRT